MNQPAKKKCFVLMPFGEKIDHDGQKIQFDTVYKYIVKEVAERTGLECVRSDEVAAAGWVHKDMIEHILHDEVVIVDITTLNPNVFYELGVRHALRPCVTILIRMKGTNLPFDIRGMRAINYGLDVESADKAKQEIEQFISNGLKNKDPDSLVYDVLPGLKISVL